jgi:hypothetical protein
MRFMDTTSPVSLDSQYRWHLSLAGRENGRASVWSFLAREALLGEESSINVLQIHLSQSSLYSRADTEGKRQVTATSVLPLCLLSL